MKKENNLPMWENCYATAFLDMPDYISANGTQCIAPYDNLTMIDGKAMKRRRNLINRFEAADSEWSFEEITTRNIDLAFEVERLWQRDETVGEAAFVRHCFRSFNELELMGGLLYSGQNAVGYSFSAPCGEDGALILVLRARPVPAGVSAMLYRQTALLLKRRLPALEMINLGCCGGMAEMQNRLSYHPWVVVPSPRTDGAV